MSPEGEQPRITDLSGLDPEDFKYRNTTFLKGDLEYEQTGYETFEQLDTLYRRGELYEVWLDFFDAELTLKTVPDG